VSFEVAADGYDRFMGRFSVPLAGLFVEAAGVRRGQRALDVGCGPGALTGELVGRLGTAPVAAVDPSAPFVEAATARFPGVDVRRATAESLPFPDDSFDVVLAQLVVHFMADPVAGLREMGRVARRGTGVGASVWDHAGGHGPLSLYWRAARDIDPAVVDESHLAGAAEGHLAELCTEAGLVDVRPTVLTVAVRFDSFEEWWEPYTLGVGTAGDHLKGLSDDHAAALRTRCVELLPSAPFEIVADAWTVLARA
jgi:SAM-dependent methyltransferase